MSIILVVDDNPAQVQLLCIMLERMNFETVPAYSGEEAIDLARDIQPDVIIMDIIMPSYSMDGYQAIKQLRTDERTAHIPVIACSSAADMKDIMVHGYQDVMPKPFDTQMLKSKIQAYI